MGDLIPLDQARKQRESRAAKVSCIDCVFRHAAESRLQLCFLDLCQVSRLPMKTDPDDGKIKHFRVSHTGRQTFLDGGDMYFEYCSDINRGGGCQKFKSKLLQAKTP